MKVPRKPGTPIMELDENSFFIVDAENNINVYYVLPFTGPEKICWDCKHPRELWVSADHWTDICT